MRGLIGSPPLSILDVSCGIGTQALGFAALDHTDTVSDISEGAVHRAHHEARQRKIEIDFSVADMRRCADVHGSGLDVLRSADNSIPHLANETEIRTAIDAFHRRLRPGGVAIVSIREYPPDEDRSSPQMLPYGIRSNGEYRHFVFQTRDWKDGTYNVAMYFVREAKGGEAAKATVGVSPYYAITIDRLISLFKEAGFVDIRRWTNNVPASDRWPPCVGAHDLAPSLSP